MKFGNAAWGFRETPLKEQLKITKEMGLAVLELGIANAPNDVTLDISKESLEEIKNLYAEYGVELLCAATGNDFTNGNKSDVEKVKRVIDICNELGVKILRIFAGFSHGEEVVGRRWTTMIECLTECARYAKGQGVTLTIETHGGVDCFDDGVLHFHSTTTIPEMLQKIVETVPENVMLNFDPANLNAVGVTDVVGVYEKLNKRIASIHLKDFAVLPSGHLRPAACGEGTIDWSKLMKALEGFDGPLMFEYENVEDVKEGLTRCMDYIYQWIKN